MIILVFDITKIFSLIMSLVTTITSLIGIANRQEWPQQIQDFNQKQSEAIVRVMSFNVRCTNVGKDSWEDRIGIVTETMVKSSADSIGVQEATPEWMAVLDEKLTGYDWVGVGRDDGKNAGEYSAIHRAGDGDGKAACRHATGNRIGRSDGASGSRTLVLASREGSDS
jgi:hypothetical protein